MNMATSLYMSRMARLYNDFTSGYQPPDNYLDNYLDNFNAIE